MHNNLEGAGKAQAGRPDVFDPNAVLGKAVSSVDKIIVAVEGDESSLRASLLQADGVNRPVYSGCGESFEHLASAMAHAIKTLSASAGGVDALVFGDGIVEYSSCIRSLICKPLKFLGFELDHHANHDHEVLLSAKGSKPVLRMAAGAEAIHDLVEGMMDRGCRREAFAA